MTKSKITARCSDCGTKTDLKKLAIINYPYEHFICEKCLKKRAKNGAKNLRVDPIKDRKKAANKAAKKAKKRKFEVQIVE